MRKLVVLLCFAAVLVLVSACENKDDDAKDFGEKFIQALYNVDGKDANTDNMGLTELTDYQNKFESYFTEKEFKELAIKRFFLIPLEIASKHNSKISVEKVSIKKDKDDLTFKHSITLTITDESGKETKEVQIKGQLSLIHTNGGFKINRYYDDGALGNL